MTAARDVDRVLAALPTDGRLVLSAQVVEASGLPPRRAWPALALLAAERLAFVWDMDGRSWAKRLDEDVRLSPPAGRRRPGGRDAVAGDRGRSDR